MRCSECQSEMVQSKVGWLCANCGHTESVKPSAVPLTPTPATKTPVSYATPPAVEAPVPIVEPTTPIASDMVSEPVAEPVPATIADTAPSPGPKALKPIKPETHPHPNSNRWVALVLIIALILGGAAYWLFFTTASPLAHQVINTPVPSATPEVSTSPSPSTSPSTSPSPSASPVAAGDATTRDTQRKTDLSGYVAAYKVASTNGFYPLKPATISFTANDPTTAVAYGIQTTKQTALGQIYYHAGGQCGGAGVTPGTNGTRYLSLTLQLEAGNSPYCLDVK